MAEVHPPSDEIQDENDVHGLLIHDSDFFEDAVLPSGKPYLCRCGKAHSPAKSPCRDPPMDPQTKEAQRRDVIDFKNLVSPVREILKDYSLLVSWRDPQLFLEDTVRLALHTPSHARDIVAYPITRIKELLEDIGHPLHAVGAFCETRDHLTTRWNRVHFDVVDMLKTLDLLKDMFTHDRDICRLRQERRLGMCAWSVLLREGLSRSLYKFQRKQDGDDT